MSSIDIFPWNENFNCGISLIDEQHEVLVQLINELASHVAFRSDIGDLNNIVSRLDKYVNKHFFDEEIIWKKAFDGDEILKNHLHTHRQFAESLEDIKNKIKADNYDVVIEELLSFLTRWLASHILEDDRYLSAIILSKTDGTSLEEAKKMAQDKLSGSTKVLVELILSIYEKLSGNALGLMREIAQRKEQEEKIRHYAEKLESVFMKSVNLVTSMCELRDPYTVGHEKQVSDIAIAIAKRMNLTEYQIETIRIGAYLHDLGKISIPAEILGKPGKLTRLEFELVKNHPQVGFELLEHVDFPWPVEQICLQHHERMDGTGYPNGIKGEDILLESRIVAVADVVDAISAHRPYRPSLGVGKAVEELERGKGTIYDANIVECFLEILRDNQFSLTALLAGHPPA